MPTYLIHYELLSRPDVEYPLLIPLLTRLDGRRLTNSSWAVKCSMGVAELRDEVQRSALTGDRFVIVEIGHWRTINTMNPIEAPLGPPAG